MNEVELAELGASAIDIPPENWLRKCWTSHQVDKWLEIKTFFFYTFNDLLLYGSGNKPLIERHDNIPQDYRKYVRTVTRVYHSLKLAVAEKWGVLEEILECLDPLEFDPFPIPQNPSEIIFLVATQDAQQAFGRCLKDSKLSRNGLYQFIGRMTEIQHLCALPPTRENNLKLQYTRNLQTVFLERAGINLEPTFEDFCVKILEREFRGEVGQHPLKVYKGFRSDLIRLNRKISHIRNQLNGELWKNGCRTIIGKGADRYNT